MPAHLARLLHAAVGMVLAVWLVGTVCRGFTGVYADVVGTLLACGLLPYGWHTLGAP